MRTLTGVALARFLVISGAHSGTLRGQRASAQPRAVPGEFIVTYKPNATPPDKLRARGRLAAAVIADLARSPRARALGSIELVRSAKATSNQAVLAALQNDPAVEYGYGGLLGPEFASTRPARTRSGFRSAKTGWGSIRSCCHPRRISTPRRTR
jgi:Fervidolysin N-terminal prodomain